MKLSPSVFFDTYSPIAVNDSMFSGIPPSIKLAQAALESGWAGSSLTENANNFFGIKSHNWGGATYNAQTHEYYGSGGPTTIQADFRYYGSPYESFMDHSAFLHKHSRYSSLFNLDPLDYKRWAIGLQNAGYATSPTYADKLIGLIEKYDLQKYDRKAYNLKAAKNISLLLFFMALIFVIFLLLKRLF